MGRRASFLVYTTIALIAWILVLFHDSLAPGVEVPAYVDEVVPALPLWVLVSLGSYLLWSLGQALFEFRDCPEAFDSLQVDVARAKAELRTRGLPIM
ncbi:hypothetical protein M427DRAFT_123257 [Gonapodya prolifera JEL478]|uniref:Dolichol-phosphate mannosyltransferase subunit 3 n=1 Tax=Gonapodya prolifera (strain JEL478) TaxID=1344416 RepID=A0A139AH10_GONPJ|nr:hypothetical protein M427DRAFT_123257 [Gonapodya prolifera JEL478]|eukprot:KXS15979.1 hypothetical protein M427DRAFT_123257 [Gonapodya prolifera JEL478]